MNKYILTLALLVSYLLTTNVQGLTRVEGTNMVIVSVGMPNQKPKGTKGVNSGCHKCDADTKSTDKEGNALEGHHVTTSNGVTCNCDFVGGHAKMGTVTWPNGDGYTGDIVNNSASGKGRYSYANGGVYNGQFYLGLQDGNGTYTFPNGDIYTGEFKNGTYEGKGTYTSEGNFIYQGSYKNGVPTQGSLKVIETNELYEGQFYHDPEGKIRIHGEGGFSSPNRGGFYGTWVNGLPEGYGIGVKFLNSYTYKGDWKDAHPDGESGTLVLPNGVRISGEFKQGKPAGNISIYKPGHGVNDVKVQKGGKIKVTRDSPYRRSPPPSAVMIIGNKQYTLSPASVDQLAEYKATLKEANMLVNIVTLAPWLDLIAGLPPVNQRLKPSDMIVEGVANDIKVAKLDQSNWSAYTLAIKALPDIIKPKLRQQIQFNMLYHKTKGQDFKFWERMLETVK